MKNFWLGCGATSAMMAVVCGAFGAHALKARLSEYSLGVWGTAAQYQMYHALALVAFGLWQSTHSEASFSSAIGAAFVLGTALFSGSLYVLALTDLRWLGAITPFGGVSFLVGWALFAWSAFSSARDS